MLASGSAWAGPVNNLTISNTALTGLNTSQGFVLIQFDASWENSWRLAESPANWDAVWIFVKYRPLGGTWQHATLNTTGHTAPSGSTLDTPSDGKGVFLYRSTTGLGTVNFTGVQLRWNYAGDGLQSSDEVELYVSGIEMVYIPQDEFAVGSGGASGAQEFTVTTINTADATTPPGGVGSRGGQAGGHPTGQVAPDNANYPNGYGAFYMMKYELTQEQYADFLNQLTATQATNRYANENGNNRHTLSGSHPSFVAGVPNRANNFMSWLDVAAYADWAALRPMSELEYEKACRGTRLPVPGEHAWGSTALHATPYTFANDGAPNSAVTNPGAENAFWGETRGTDPAFQGPLRAGIFAASFATPNRREAGATFYGVMEMTGNVLEPAISITHRAFTDTHGDGTLAANGDADTATWPTTGSLRIRLRGGSVFTPSISVESLRLSYRDASIIDTASRSGALGFRGVRSAP